MKRLIWLSYFLLLATISCKQCEKKDVIKRQPVKGMVFNNCTDSGLANVTVYLQTFNNNTIVKSREEVSGSDGGYVFDAAEIHSSEKYSYAIHVPSSSGTNGAGGTNVGFDGTTMHFLKNEADIFMRPKVTPRFLILNLYLIKYQATAYSDSLVAMFYQNRFMKNRPDLPYSFGGSAHGDQMLIKGNIGSYPMGLYNIAIDKWIGGVHVQVKDSMYLDWGAQKTYTVFW